MATAQLKVLPRFRELAIIQPPRSHLEAPDVLTRPQRYATEDYFRFKEYAAGMDTRRIHWRLSIRTGTLQVRQPETKEISTQRILLVLDCYLPPGRMLSDAVGMGQVLDGLVETWISLASELVERGDQVTLAAPVDDGDGNIRVEQLSCGGGGAGAGRTWGRGSAGRGSTTSRMCSTPWAPTSTGSRSPRASSLPHPSPWVGSPSPGSIAHPSTPWVSMSPPFGWCWRDQGRGCSGGRCG